MPCLEKLELEDKWILSKLNTVIAEVTENMDHYELGVAGPEDLRLYLGHLLRLVH